jgi:hypothetical protein
LISARDGDAWGDPPHGGGTAHARALDQFFFQFSNCMDPLKICSAITEDVADFDDRSRRAIDIVAGNGIEHI